MLNRKIVCLSLRFSFVGGRVRLHVRGVAMIFQRGEGGHRQGHHPGIADCIWFIPLLSLVYQRAQSYYRGMKAHINLREEPLTKILYKKINFKKVGFSTMASTAKILSWRFRHLNIVGCLLKRRPTKGGRGHGHPRTPDRRLEK